MSTRIQERKRRGPDRVGPSWGLVGTRLQRPASRPGAVFRDGLVQLLCDSHEPVISVSAPAGYGKTTLLAQWTEADLRPSAWLSIGEDCNDPTVLLGYLTAALTPVTAIPDDVLEELESVQPRMVSAVVGGMGDAIRTVDHPFVFVIDDLHALTDDHGLDAVSVLTEHLAAGSQIVLLSRHQTGLPLAAARARGGVFELGVSDLRFDRQGAARLLRGAGAEDLGEDEVAVLTERCEGWAVGLYLAALSRTSGQSLALTGETFGGDDRFIADYLREEVLSRLPDGDVDFLVRTSVLDEMWGPLCDATLETTGSGAMLERLESSDLLVVPLDHHRERYRYHHLFREFLRMELQHREPELLPVLTGRASVWCEGHGMPDLAITYAIAGGLTDRVSGLLTRFTLQTYYGGRAESVRRWMTWLDDHASIDDHPAVAVMGGMIMALMGRATEAERWAAASDGLDRSADDHQILAVRAVMNAMMCRLGVDQMLIDSEEALSLLAPVSDWRPAAMLFHSVSLLLLGRVDEAVEELIDLGALGAELGTAPAVCTGFTELAVVAIDRGDIEAAAAWIARALDLLDERALHGYASTGLTHVIASRVFLLQGDQLRARRHLDEATPLRALLTSAIPMFALQARIELARCAIGLGDADAAERFLDEGAELLRHRPGLGTLVDEFASVREEFDRVRLAGAGLPSLTPAEARLLPLLTTHLSFREIGEQLFVSPHTVKTQAISIYRKLGVSSRGSAIDAARAVGG